jgi:pimeloyl-ACP methyl ester carboxylesterase
MRERVLRIGKPQPLTAIASVPKDNVSKDMAVIIVNSGVMHHIGTCRMSVRIARELANKGYLALRFDFSGIGDSVPRSGTMSFTESAASEIKEVIDYLQKKKGITRFTLMGLCSGADAIYESALLDERIDALCQIDPYCYRTTRWKINHWGSRLFDPKHWVRFMKYRLGMMHRESAGEYNEEDFELPTYVRDFPPRDEISAGLNKLFSRNLKLQALFTGEKPQLYNYEKQFEDSMPDVDFKDLFTTSYLPKCSHILSEPDQQLVVLDKISAWMEAKESSVEAADINCSGERLAVA